MARKAYTPEFKETAVRLARERGTDDDAPRPNLLGRPDVPPNAVNRTRPERP